MIRPVDFFSPLDLTADISFQSCDEFGKCSVGNKRKQNRMLKKSANRVNCEKTSLWPFSFVSVGTSVLAMCFPECMYTHVDYKLQKLNLLFNILYFLQESGSLMFILQWTKGVSLRGWRLSLTEAS